MQRKVSTLLGNNGLGNYLHALLKSFRQTACHKLSGLLLPIVLTHIERVFLLLKKEYKKDYLPITGIKSHEILENGYIKAVILLPNSSHSALFSKKAIPTYLASLDTQGRSTQPKWDVQMFGLNGFTLQMGIT